MNHSRLFNTVRNVSWRFIVLFMTAVINLIIPRYIILTYGSEVNGLTSSIAHVLMIVNLIQAGLGSSVTYLMYKPIGEQDRVELASIIMSAKRLYRIISLAVLGLGTIASIIFAYVVDTDLQRDFILIASLLTCIDSAASTYFTAVGNVFLGAKQDGYLVSRISIIANMIGFGLRVLVLVLKPHFITLFLVNTVVCIINIVALAACFKKQYVPFKPSEEETKKIHRVPIKGISYAAANEAAHALITGSITVVISVWAGLKASSIFGVYMIATSALSTVSNAVYSAVVPSYGSVAAEGDIAKTNRIFEIYQFVLFTMNTFMYMCAAYLLIPFVHLYTEGVSDAEYTNIPLMIMVVCYGLASVLRIPYNNTVYIKGLFKETYMQPVICSVIAMILMVLFTSINFTYTLLGTIFFFLSNALYQHFKLPKLFAGFDNRRFWNHLAVMCCGVGMSILAFFLFPVSPSNFFWWIVYACITGVVSLAVMLLLVLLFDRKSLRHTIDYFMKRKQNKQIKGEK